MGEEQEMKKSMNYGSIRRLGMFFNLFASAGKYGSLVYGVLSVLDKEVNLDTILAGGVYAVSETFGYLANLCVTQSGIEELREKDLGNLANTLSRMRISGKFPKISDDEKKNSDKNKSYSSELDEAQEMRNNLDYFVKKEIQRGTKKRNGFI